VDEYDFRSVVVHLQKQVVKSLGLLRISYLLVLEYLVVEFLPTLNKSDLEWLMLSTIYILHDPVIAALSHEESIFFRTRASYFLRSSIISNVTEAVHLELLRILLHFLNNNAEPRTENELQLALSELTCLICILGEAGYAHTSTNTNTNTTDI